MIGFDHLDTKSGVWRPLSDGVELMTLRAEPGEGRILLRFAPGKGYPRHVHPSAEEVFVIDGIYCDMGVEYSSGSYLYYPPGSAHAPSSVTGCTFMVMAREWPRIAGE